MFKQRKPKRFNYKSQTTSNEAKRHSDLKSEFESLKRQPKGNSTKVSTIVILLGLLFAVCLIMYFLESKMN